MKSSNEGSATKGAQGTTSSSRTETRTSDLSSTGARRAELSATDKAVQEAVKTKQGPQALTDTSTVKVEKMASMTPSEFWSSKLGECYTKGISPADCKPWS